MAFDKTCKSNQYFQSDLQNYFWPNIHLFQYIYKFSKHAPKFLFARSNLQFKIFINIENWLFDTKQTFFLSPKINTLIIAIITVATRSYILRREKRQVNKSDFSRSARPTGLLGFYLRRGCKMTRSIVSFPGETRIRRKMWKVLRTFIVIPLYAFKLFARSISIRGYIRDTYSLYLEQLYDLGFYSARGNDEGMAGIKCAEKKRFRV